MKKLLLSIALVLSAGNVLGLALDINMYQQQKALSGCIPSGYSTRPFPGQSNVIIQGGSSTSQGIFGPGTPIYDNYAKCLQQSHAQPAQVLYKMPTLSY